VLGKPADVLTLPDLPLTHTEAGGQEELTAFEELGRVGELGDVQPVDLVVETFVSRSDVQAEPGKSDDVADSQQGEHFDMRAKPTVSVTARQPEDASRRRGVWTIRPTNGTSVGLFESLKRTALCALHI
jgi:hypothetical protein